MKYTRWLLYSAFLVLASTCLGQRGSDWRVYQAADGLPETAVSAVSIGPHGFLWVRHPNVEWASRLSGYDINAIPSPGLGNTHIYESTSGQIWTCNADGLAQYDKVETTWTHYTNLDLNAELRHDHLTPSRPLALAPFKQNHVLILFPDALLDCNVDNPNHPQTTLLRAVTETGLLKFSNLTSAHDGGLWLIGARGLAKIPTPLRNLKSDTEWPEHLLPGDAQFHNPREPVEDTAGNLTVLAESSDTAQVIAGFAGNQWTMLPVADKQLTQAWRDGDTYWATSYNSLFQMKPGEKQFVADESISAHRVFDVAVQTNGVFWLATSEGLFRHAPLVWQTSTTLISSSSIGGFAEDSFTNLWVLSSGSLNRYQSNVWSHYPFPLDIFHDASENRSLFVLTNNLILFQGGDQLWKFDPPTENYAPLSGFNPLPRIRFKALGLLKDGNLCVQKNADLTNGPGELALYDGTNFSEFPYPQPDPASSSNLLFLVASQNGDLWLSGNNSLIWFHDKKWQTFAGTSPAVSGAPSCLLEIGEGKIWCGIQDKLIQFDGKTWTAVRAGFFHVNALIKARDGSIWVASDNGLHHFFHDTWIASSLEEGLPSATVHQVYEDHDGRVWAGTTRGLSLNHPDADPDAPRTYVQNLPVPNNTVPEGSIVTVGFSAIDKWKYTPIDRLMYSYRLDGLDWSPYQEQRNASFLDLSAGKHIFRVRSLDRNWNVDPKPAELEFAIAQPWYRESRLIFISGTGLAVALFFASLAFNRHRQLLRSYAEVEAKVAMRTKQLDLANQELFHSQKMNALGTLAAGIAHDFNNILSIIKGSAQIIEENLDNETKIRTRTDRIKTVVEQGTGIVQAMLGFSRTSERELAPCNVNTIVRNTITLLGDRFLREVEVKFNPAIPDPPEVPASKDFLQQILLNFIFNAAESSTGHRQIILSTAQSTQLPPSLALKPSPAHAYLFISVQDFGSGISPEVMPRIFEPFFTTKSLSVRRGTGLGLSMVYELARQMECGLSVESTVSQGSTFTLIIPERPLTTVPSPPPPG